jgi:hypothetical protein
MSIACSLIIELDDAPIKPYKGFMPSTRNVIGSSSIDKSAITIASKKIEC